MDALDPAGAVVTPHEDSPLLLRGSLTLRDAGRGDPEPGRGMVAVCRCGKSRIKPFCDGTHKVTGFARPPVARDPEQSGVRGDPRHRATRSWQSHDHAAFRGGEITKRCPSTYRASTHRATVARDDPAVE